MACGETAFTGASCLEPIRHAPLQTLTGEPQELFTALANAVADILRASDVCVALSGGVDSALVVALIRALDLPMPRLVTLRTGYPAYDEVDEAKCVARAFDATCEVIDVTPSDYDAALPDVIDAVAQPLYNLHPVSRWLLARRAECGTLLTGDGADQVLSGTPSALYLPLVHAICAACDVELASPFFARDVAFVPRDPEKRTLRVLAERLGVPKSIAHAAKRPRLTPDLPQETRKRTLACFVERLRRC